jgi:hypothetical protein
VSGILHRSMPSRTTGCNVRCANVLIDYSTLSRPATYGPICAPTHLFHRARYRRIFRDASRRRGIAGRGGVFGAASPRRGLRSTSTRDQNISSTVEGLGLLVTEARAWLSSWSVRSVHCSRTGSGHMGATPQPKRTIASEGNQHWRFRKSGISNVSGSNQRPAESIDTVGVTGSIPVSPTLGGPGFRGLQSFPEISRAALGPHERWVRWLAMVPVWPRCGPAPRRR